MQGRKHLFDEIADECAEFVEEESDIIAELLYDGRFPPFGAPVSKEEQLNYYERQFFHHDGTPNDRGRAAVLERVGADGFEEIATQLLKRRRKDAEEDDRPRARPDGVSGQREGAGGGIAVASRTTPVEEEDDYAG